MRCGVYNEIYYGGLPTLLANIWIAVRETKLFFIMGLLLFCKQLY